MKIKGRSDLGARTLTVLALPRGEERAPILLTIEAFSLGLETRLDEVAPFPRPPEAFKVDRRGRELRDPKTDKPIVFEDAADPGFQQRLMLTSNRRIAYLARVALSKDGNVEFESTPATDPLDARDPKAWADYADALLAEFAAAGFTDGELQLIANEARRISTPTAEQAKEARDAFLRRAEGSDSPLLRVTEAGAPSAT